MSVTPQQSADAEARRALVGACPCEPRRRSAAASAGRYAAGRLASEVAHRLPLASPAVKPHWCRLLVLGEKTWELRGSATHVRGRVALVASGTGCIHGGATLVACHGPLTEAQLAQTHAKHCVPAELLRGARRYKKVRSTLGQKAAAEPHALALAR